jgi:hypothetical protein
MDTSRENPFIGLSFDNFGLMDSPVTMKPTWTMFANMAAIKTAPKKGARVTKKEPTTSRPRVMASTALKSLSAIWVNIFSM